GSLYFGVFNVSADGKKIAFASRAAREDVFTINSDGTGLRQLTDDPQRDRVPSFSPDGNRIYFYSERAGNWEIWSIRPDGSGLTQITRTPPELGMMLFPQVSPDGSRLLTFQAGGSYIWHFGFSSFEPLQGFYSG